MSLLRKVSEQVAIAVYQTAIKQGVAQVDTDLNPAEEVRKHMWEPVYLPFKLPKK